MRSSLFSRVSRIAGGAALGGWLTLAQAAPVSAAEITTVASGLDNPRGLTVGANGAIYVAEAGRGGDGTCIAAPEGGQQCYGASGAISRILDGKQERIANGLPSMANELGNNAIGPHHLANVAPGVTYVTVGLGADPAVRDQFELEGVDFGQLIQLMPDGKWRSLHDISDYEAMANPDGGVADSNPYGLLAGPTGWIVADAGGNALISMPLGSTPSTLAVFPNREIEHSIPALPNPLSVQSVPTSVGLGPDGALYVGELTGFPFPAGEARVYRVVPGQEPSVYAEGFTNVIDIAFGPDGNLYVLEMARDGLLSAMTAGTEPTGRLVRVAPDGTQTTLATDELSAPGGLALGADGAVYVTNHSTSAGGGEVLRIKL
jgi:hypothetical protein